MTTFSKVKLEPSTYPTVTCREIGLLYHFRDTYQYIHYIDLYGCNLSCCRLFWGGVRYRRVVSLHSAFRLWHWMGLLDILFPSVVCLSLLS